MQLDSFTGSPITETRLRRVLRGEAELIKGKRICDAGSGAGRFTEILLKWSGVVHSFDYPNAVETNFQNNKNNNLLLIRADIYEIPFQKQSYDYVICLGVLRHTPSPEMSIERLWEMVRPGGRLIFDHYRPIRTTSLPPPIGPAEPLYRELILGLHEGKRFSFVKQVVDFWILKRLPLAQKLLTRVSPLHFYYTILKFRTKKSYYDWALLDTHDSTTDFLNIGAPRSHLLRHLTHWVQLTFAQKLMEME